MIERYWSWVGSNIGAMPLQAVITVSATLALRKPLARWWHKHFGVKADLDDIRQAAAAAHRIAADLFEHHTGTAHPAAPEAPKGGERA